MADKKIAVIFPGIGYHKDKPLLYYAAKLMRAKGYTVAFVEYHNMPSKIMGDAKMLKKAGEQAYKDTVKQLKMIDFDEYNDIVFIGKSIGTVALSKYVHDCGIDARQVWYTPVAETFAYESKDVMAFIGDADPWSDVDAIKEDAKSQGITLYSYPDCNHSLECDDVAINIANLSDVMKKTDEYIR